MSFLFENQETPTARGIEIDDTVTPSFEDNFRAAADYAKYGLTSTSRAKAFEDVLQPLVDEMNAADVGETFQNPASNFRIRLFEPEAQLEAFRTQLGKLNKALDLYPQFEQFRGLYTYDKVSNQAYQLARDARDDFLQISGDSPSTSAGAARLLGTMTYAMDDPIIISSMMFGGAKGLLQMAFQEAALGAGSEFLIQDIVQDWHKTTGMEYTNEQFWDAVMYGGLIGFGFPFAFRGVGKGVSLTYGQLKSGLAAIKKTGARQSPDAQAAEELADDLAEIANDNPLERTIAGEAEHEQRLFDSVDAFDKNQAPGIPNTPGTPARPLLSVTDADKVDGMVQVFDPDEIMVDAELFQFKAGGDEFGVTERLQGVKQWDPIAAGQIVVYEFADGRKFIADGHQRLGLAKRIKSQDPKQSIQLLGHTLREVDGITPDMARVIAAVKNIKEGTGTAIDAAKILRGAPDRAGELPPRSALVQQARGLVFLDDDTFGAIINNVIPASYGAIVGRLIPDNPGLQKNAIQVLAKTDPANEFQAESIVRQVLEAGAETRKQDTLFGEELITESYFLERAKVLDAARKQLRQDKAAFASLLRNAERIEAEGNQLATKQNERRTANDSQAIALIQAQANRKGPLSDALTAAARQARESGSYGQATRGFVEAVRRSVESGDFDRLTAGDVGQSVNVAAESRASAAEAEPDVTLFDDPVGPGAQRQADQLETDLRIEEESIGSRPPEEPTVERKEGFQEDVELRKDLMRIIDEGADEATVDSHPAVVQALEQADAIPKTVDADDYGTPLFQDRRQFKIDGDRVVGYENAIYRFFVSAQTLAYRNKGMDVPDAPIDYQGQAIIITGPPAAGKSTYADDLAVETRSAIIDSDEIKKEMPEFGGGIGAMAVHEESSEIAKLMLNTILPFSPNIVVPKVGDNNASINALRQQLQDAGYKVQVVLVDVAYPEARRRMFRRFGDTGRLVGPEYVRSVGDKPTSNYNILKEEGQFDGYAKIDNNGSQEVGPRLIEDEFDGPAVRKVIEGIQLRLESSRAARGVEGRPGQEVEAQPAETAAATKAESDARQALDETEIPIGSTVDEFGEQVAVTVTRRQMLDDIQQDKAMLDRLRGCVE